MIQRLGRLLFKDVAPRDLDRKGAVTLTVVTLYLVGFACFAGWRIYEAGDRWQGCVLAASSLGPMSVYVVGLVRYRRRNQSPS